MSAPPVDRELLVRQIMAARIRGQFQLAEQLEAQYVEACVAPAPTKERDVRSIPTRDRNSVQRFEWPPPFDHVEARKQRGIDGATWAASLPEHEAQAAVFNRQRR